MFKRLLIILSILTIELSTVKVYFESIFEHLSHTINDSQEDNQESSETKLVQQNEIYCESVSIHLQIFYFIEAIRPKTESNESLPLSYLKILSPPPQKLS